MSGLRILVNLYADLVGLHRKVYICTCVSRHVYLCLVDTPNEMCVILV